MKQHIAAVTLLIDEYDRALEFYIPKLNFRIVEDTTLSEMKRWVVIAPPGNLSGCNLLLAKAANDEQRRYIGNQTGGRVFLFLYTDNFKRDHANLHAHTISIVREPSIEVYGTVLVFKDLYGNLIDLIQPL